MKFIAHRGNMNGPNPAMENKPEYIQQALDAGYDVEVDVWCISSGKSYDIFLGHDGPQYGIKRFFLQNARLWCHCKDTFTYNVLSKFSNIKCFYQDHNDKNSAKISSTSLQWGHSENPWFTKDYVNVHIDNINSLNKEFSPKYYNSFAICSDYVMLKAEMATLPFDLLILDIDGVLTDGTKMYDRDGRVFGKRYCDLDFTAIKRFMAAGIKVCFLSGDKTVNEQMAASRGIDFFHNAPGEDKVDYLMVIKERYRAKKVAYIGDDYYDLGIMNNVDFPFCPKNSFITTANVINVKSGDGVVAGLYSMYEEKIPYVFPVDSEKINPK